MQSSPHTCDTEGHEGRRGREGGKKDRVWTLVRHWLSRIEKNYHIMQIRAETPPVRPVVTHGYVRAAAGVSDES